MVRLSDVQSGSVNFQLCVNGNGWCGHLSEAKAMSYLNPNLLLFPHTSVSREQQSTEEFLFRYLVIGQFPFEGVCPKQQLPLCMKITTNKQKAIIQGYD